jgi:hypothetical protein
MPNSLAAVYCRIKHLDVFYILRQGHDRRYLLKDSFDWITSREWSNAVDVLRSALTTALQEEDSLALSEAQKEVKQVLWKYVQGSLLNGYRRFQNLDKPDSRVYILLGKLGLKPLGGLLKRFWLDKQRKISLTRLLDKNYDAYMDFKPLYNLITKK